VSKPRDYITSIVGTIKIFEFSNVPAKTARGRSSRTSLDAADQEQMQKNAQHGGRIPVIT
jgi:hypothetical protein